MRGWAKRSSPAEPGPEVFEEFGGLQAANAAPHRAREAASPAIQPSGRHRPWRWRPDRAPSEGSPSRDRRGARARRRGRCGALSRSVRSCGGRACRPPLRRESQPTLWGHASRVPGRGWRGWLRPLRSPGRPRSGRPWRARGRQVAHIGGNLNHLGAVSGLVERRRRPHWDDLPSHLAGEKPRPAAGFVDTPRSQRRLMAFPLGIAGGERPPAEGGMGVHMPTLRDADRGIPKGGVAPFFGRKRRSGVAAPAAVVQL